MATISLNAQKTNMMSEYLSGMGSAVTSFCSDLWDLGRKALSVDRADCNLDDVIDSLKTSTQTLENRVESLEEFRKENEAFISLVHDRDSKSAAEVNQCKEDFYEKYDYLRPDCEKSRWERFCDGCKAVGEWCKEHWESLVSIVIVVVVAAAIIVLSVVTFGGAAVLAAVLVGVAVGVLSQLGSDLISFAATGKWTGTWQSYVGAAFGGAVGGALFLLTKNSNVASMASSGFATFFTQHLENLTGGQQRSSLEILLNTGIDVTISFALGKIFDKAGKSISKSLASHFDVFKRLAGAGSYSASYKMVLTKLKNGQIKNWTIKTFRNGLFSGLQDGFFDIIFGGLRNVGRLCFSD